MNSKNGNLAVGEDAEDADGVKRDGSIEPRLWQQF
jgi:hypothetical protein